MQFYLGHATLGVVVLSNLTDISWFIHVKSVSIWNLPFRSTRFVKYRTRGLSFYASEGSLGRRGDSLYLQREVTGFISVQCR